MRPLSRSLGIGAVLWLAACASTAESRATTTGGDRTVLAAAELEAEPGRNMEDVIRRHRPQWLVRRGATTLGEEGDVVVYQDGVRVGGPGVLRNITSNIVESARYLSAAEATTRFGTGHPHGAILIVTRRR